jgi:hypothetical protein
MARDPFGGVEGDLELPTVRLDHSLSVVSAAIDIAGGVFSPAAGYYPSKQLDVFVLHDRHRKA